MTERIKLINDYLEGGWSRAALARRYGLSRKTIYKWIERYNLEQWEGLKDRSRAPITQARAIPEEIVEQIVALKAKWPLWGAPRIHQKLRQLLAGKYCPSASTVSNILQRLGLTRQTSHEPILEADSIQAGGPNDVWSADLNGAFQLGNGQRCAPLTIIDTSTHFLLLFRSIGSVRSGENLVKSLFEKTFRKYGLPRAIRTNNAPSFYSQGLGGLTPLSVWWLKLGIDLERPEPGDPRANDQANDPSVQMHQSIVAAVSHPPASNHKWQQAKHDQYRREFNGKPLDEAPQSQVPAQQYRRSPREWTERKFSGMHYNGNWECREVMPDGHFEWNGRQIASNPALAAERIGFEPQEDGVWRVWYGSHELGRLDERMARITALR